MERAKPIFCLRCKRTLEPQESRCKICAASDSIQVPNVQAASLGTPDMDNQTKAPAMKSSDRILGFLGLFMFFIILAAMIVGFLREVNTNDLGSAIKTRPAILIVIGVFLLFWILSSQNKFESVGLGLIHKIIRLLLIGVVAITALIILLTLIDGTSSSQYLGLPDNIRF